MLLFNWCLIWFLHFFLFHFVEIAESKKYSVLLPDQSIKNTLLIYNIMISVSEVKYFVIRTFRMYFEHLFAFADEVLEQADYLYSCAEIEKLHQLLLLYKDR